MELKENQEYIKIDKYFRGGFMFVKILEVSKNLVFFARGSDHIDIKDAPDILAYRFLPKAVFLKLYKNFKLREKK